MNFEAVGAAVVDPKSPVKKFGPLNEDDHRNLLPALDSKPKARGSVKIAREPKVTPKLELELEQSPGLGDPTKRRSASPALARFGDLVNLRP